MQYRYFIAYTFQQGNSVGIRNSETRMNEKIKSIQDIDMIARSIERDNDLEKSSVVIMNWKLFEE